jgi:pyruvate formate lyase activating enzyme
MLEPLTQSNYPGRWWTMLADGRLECRLCPRFCKLNEGQRGFCFVRRRVGDAMALTTYGRSSGFCVDPIEKKPLNHFLPGSSILSFGTAGCNLGCRFCQNWDISKAREWDKLADAASPEQIARAAQGLGCRSVAFTYNDPVIFAEYAIDVAQACHERGVKAVAVTAGYITADARPEFYGHMDAANVDLKAFSEEFYHRLCFASLAPVLETLKFLRDTSVWFEVTTLLIPGENDSDGEIHAAAEWFAENLGPDVPWHFTAFHPDFKMLDKPRTPAQTLTRAREIARSKGLHYVYTGNVHDSAGGSTWCPRCGNILIERDWYELGEWNLDGNQCAFCGWKIAGLFEERPGSWGARRQPVQLSTRATAPLP